MTPEERTLAAVFEATFDRAHDPEYGSIRLRALFASIAELLEEAGRITDPQVADLKRDALKPAPECHGYACDTEDDVLALFFCIDANEETPLGGDPLMRTVAKDAIERGFKRLEAFVEHATSGALDDVDPSDRAAELIALAKDAKGNGSAIELHVVTTGRVSDSATLSRARKGISREVWDIVRLSRVSGAREEGGIEIDFRADHGHALPCLVTPKDADQIQVFLTCIPAPLLADIYNTHRGRLLERNVRSFLQFTGKVNKGIRDTLLNEPGRFLAYNNGLSATAAGVQLEHVEGDLARIKAVSEFQIVNGGQTTASIASCVRRDKADLSGVSIQMKLTVVPETRIDELVPRISKFANTQNRIQEADFHANHPWHVELEKLSRNAWTAPSSDAPRGTRWFFERSRGQYADELAAAKTPAGRKKFRLENPPKQKFVKTDLAKFVLSWEQEPSVVCRGAQKCFVELMNRFVRQQRAVPSQEEFKRIVSMAILFRTGERLYGELGHQGYRAQVVAHAVARLSFAVGQLLPWDAIWSTQALPSALELALKRCVMAVRETVITPPSGGNVTEWSKKPECWSRVRALSVDLSGLDLQVGDGAPQNGAGASGPASDLVRAVMAVAAAPWFEVSTWAKQTGSLMPWQRSLAFSMGKLASTGRAPSEKQATQARILLLKACDLGFGHAELTPEVLERLQSAQ